MLLFNPYTIVLPPRESQTNCPTLIANISPLHAARFLFFITTPHFSQKRTPHHSSGERRRRRAHTSPRGWSSITRAAAAAAAAAAAHRLIIHAAVVVLGCLTGWIAATHSASASLPHRVVLIRVVAQPADVRRLRAARAPPRRAVYVYSQTTRVRSTPKAQTEVRTCFVLVENDKTDELIR